MASTGTNIGLAYGWALGESGWNTSMDANLRKLDALTQGSVKDKDLATPPASPADGDCYIVAASPTGAWASQAGKVARWWAGRSAWEFYTPKEGWRLYVVDEAKDYRYESGAWAMKS